MSKHVFAFVVLALPTAACSQQSVDSTYAQATAFAVKHDCQKSRPDAPNPAFAHHLDRLCDCSERKISTSGLSPDDSEDAKGQKIQKRWREAKALQPSKGIAWRYYGLPDTPVTA
jgi:hypothetical protein